MGRKFFVKDASEPCGGLVFVHGQGDHVRRHAATFDALAETGISVVAPELPGHGEAEGRRGHIPGLAMTDGLIGDALLRLRESLPGLPCGIAGHSMGGLLVTDYFGRGNGAEFEWVWLSSPLVEAGHGKPAWLQAAGRFLAKIVPAFTIATGVRPGDDIEGGDDPDRVAAERASGTHSRISVGWGAELLNASRRVAAHSSELFGQRPVLVTHGEDDHVCPLSYSQALFEQLPTSDKEIVIVPGARHEPWRDPELIAGVCEWMGARARARSGATA